MNREGKGKRAKRVNVQKIILYSVAAAGIITVGLLAPNVLGAMAKFGILPGKRQREIVETSRSRMVKRGLLAYENGKLRLAKKGEEQLRRLRLLDYKLKKPKRWDGKWRVLIFDIPEDRKTLRDKVRNTFEMLGFKRLQDSVWIYPYDCEDLIALMKADFRVGKDLLYLVVESLEYDRPLREHFKLIS